MNNTQNMPYIFIRRQMTLGRDRLKEKVDSSTTMLAWGELERVGGGGTTCHRAHFAHKKALVGTFDSDGTLLERIWKYYII
jgi:hypothetical protein